MKNLYQQARAARLEISNLFPRKEIIKTDDISDVIVILGSSRSGSTLLHQILSSHPQINSLPGEEITYFRLMETYNINSANDDDRLMNVTIDYSRLGNEILRDAGKKVSTTPLTHFEILDRIILQFPEILNEQSLQEISAICQKSVSFYDAIQKLGLNLLNYENNLLNEHSDLAKDKIIIEEPPYIFPQKRIFKKESRNILLLKSSSNAYHMDHITSLFPNAMFHYILLKRKAEGVINGLYDGWNSSGFHSHQLSHICELNITDYPSKMWWKFDLPPGWFNFINKPLVEVAGFQWSSAYKNILTFLENKKFSVFDYEFFFNNSTLESKLNDFLTSIDLQPINLPSTLPLTMSTHRPEVNRWLEKKELINKITGSSEISALNQKLQEIR